MATTRFNNNIIAVSRRMNDERSDATAAGDTGMVWTSAQWSDYQNQVIREIILDLFRNGGPKIIESLIPEIMKTSANLQLDANLMVAKPADAWMFADLRLDGGVMVERVTMDVTRKLQGRDPFAGARPFFYEEDGFIKCGGSGVISTDKVRGRYIRHLNPITPSNVPVGGGNGKYDQTNFATWSAGSRQLSAGAVPLPSGFAEPADLGKTVLFFNPITGLVYDGVIEDVISTTAVQLVGENLPTANIIGQINRVFMPDHVFDTSDIVLTPVWDGPIRERMVQLAMADEAAQLSQ